MIEEKIDLLIEALDRNTAALTTQPNGILLSAEPLVETPPEQKTETPAAVEKPPAKPNKKRRTNIQIDTDKAVDAAEKSLTAANDTGDEAMIEFATGNLDTAKAEKLKQDAIANGEPVQEQGEQQPPEASGDTAPPPPADNTTDDAALQAAMGGVPVQELTIDDVRATMQEMSLTKGAMTVVQCIQKQLKADGSPAATIEEIPPENFSKLIADLEACEDQKAPPPPA